MDIVRFPFIVLLLIFSISAVTLKSRACWPEQFHRSSSLVLAGGKLKPDDTTSSTFFDDFMQLVRTPWSGNVEAFTQADARLVLTEAAVSPAYVATANDRLANTVWEAGLQIDGNLSSGNYIRIYLSATADSLRGPHLGYHLQIDGSGGNHVYKLYRQNGGTRITIFQSAPIPNQDARFRARVRVVRDRDANWFIYADEYDTGTFERVFRNNGDAFVHDDRYDTGGFAGYFVNFSPTRRAGYHLDYLMIGVLNAKDEPMPDTVPPKLVHVQVQDSNFLVLNFDKRIAPETESSQFLLLPTSTHPSEISVTEGRVTLRFSSMFLSGDHQLSIRDIANVDGFAMVDDTVVNFSYFPPYMARPGDVIINEIMANPNGVSGLPQQEYIELYNTTDIPIELRDWSYRSLTTNVVLQGGVLPPKSYLILCRNADTASFRPLGNTQGLAPWPALVNNGTSLTLRNPQGVVIDEVSYGLSWYHDNRKRGGGWSLERIMPGHPCYGGDFWMASTDLRGGTPGMQNSVFDEDLEIQQEIVDWGILADGLRVSFSHALDTHDTNLIQRFVLSNDYGSPNRVTVNNERNVFLHYDQEFASGKRYLLQLDGIADCSGKRHQLQLDFFLPDVMSKGDILINEILFNPKADGVDFVEIYNFSNKTFDLQQLYLAHVNASGQVAGHRQVSLEPLLFPPNSYKVLTSKPDIVQQQYRCPYPEVFVALASLPAFANTSGTAVLISNELTIDSFSYQESMHSPFISNPKGVSLERSSFSKPTNQLGNFHSAATTIGGATPGYQNSQREIGQQEAAVFLTSKTFSPDADGFEDLLEINFRFDETGKMGNISIYNDQGRLVRQLLRNQSLGTTGKLTWDGVAENGQRSTVGIYVVFIEIYDENGVRKVYRESFVLAGKR